VELAVIRTRRAGDPKSGTQKNIKSLGRTGQVFEHRYHATPLTSPRQTRHALAYVLDNWRRHQEDMRGERQRRAILDPYSSAIAFTGWDDFVLGPWPPGYTALPVASPRTWLLDKGWRLANKPLRAREVPGPFAYAFR
jgi:hypothetical protein